MTISWPQFLKIAPVPSSFCRSSAGDDYDALNETYVIFITENDVLKAGLPIYHVERTVQETGTVFNDQAHIVYVNSQIKDETALGKLMHDFFCTNSKDMYYPVLANRVWYFKENEKGVATMCRAMEQMRDETAAEQNIKTLLVSVKNLMKNMNLSPEQAMNAMGISEADRQALLQLL